MIYISQEVTLDNLKDEKFIYLPLIQAERAWGYAMQVINDRKYIKI